jgi:uncharacterized protein YlxW (UPF0749 family)
MRFFVAGMISLLLVIVLSVFAGIGLQKKIPSIDYVSHEDLDQKLDLLRQEQKEQNNQIFTTSQHLVDIDRRMAHIDAENIEARLAKLELVMETNQSILVGILIAMASLVVERILHHAGVKKKE